MILLPLLILVLDCALEETQHDDHLDPLRSLSELEVVLQLLA